MMEKQLTVKSGDVESVSENQIKATENRKYSLNKSKAMKKKFHATEREEITVTETGGGMKFSFNAGTYELLKLASEEFFGSVDQPYSCNRIPVHDKKGNLVETKYKMASGMTSYYTLNMYHTKCTCLVNGKQTAYFMETDLPKIIDLVEDNLQSENTSVNEVNENIKKLITVYYKSSENDQDAEVDSSPASSNTNANTSTCANNEDESEEECPSDGMDSSFLSQSMLSDSMIVCEESEISLSLRNSETESTSNDIINIIAVLQKSVDAMRVSIENHVVTTNNHFGQIKDEVQSLKKQLAVISKDSYKQVEEVRESTEGMKTKLDKTTETVLRRLQ